jgi:hypothetical protein
MSSSSSSSCSVTYVSGYWFVPQNTKHLYEGHYKPLLAATMAMFVDKPMVFFYGQDFIRNSLSSFRNIQFVKLPVHQLPTYAVSATYLANVKARDLRIPWKPNEKHCIHVQRELHESGEDSYRKVFSIWTSKVLLMKKIATENPYRTTHFAWVDAGLSKFRREPNLYRAPSYPRHNLYYFTDNEMLYLNESIPLIACFMVATESVWVKLSEPYLLELHQNKTSGYSHDEETLLFILEKKYKYLFRQK